MIEKQRDKAKKEHFKIPPIAAGHLTENIKYECKMKTASLENLWLLIQWNLDLSSDPTVILLDIYMEKCVYMPPKDCK